MAKTTTISKAATKTTAKTATKRTTVSRTAATPEPASTAVIEHTFSNGTKVTGTYTQLETIAKALGLKLSGVKAPVARGYYMSESKGLVKISEMNDYHIRRALLKISKEYYAGMYDKNDTNSDFLNKYVSLTNDQTVQDLYTELASRK